MAVPSVAVIVTCFNLGRTLAESLRSVDDQTLRPAELVVVDDGSDDLYTQQALAAEGERGRRILRCNNRGVSAARNTGISVTTAPLLVMLDADDLLDPTYLQKAAERLADDGSLSFVSSGMESFGLLDGVWYQPEPSLLNCLAGRVVHSSSMFRRSVWEAVGGFDEQFRAHEEVEFWTAVISAGFCGAVLQEPLLKYRVRTDSLYQWAMESGTHEELMARIYAKHRAALEPIVPDLLVAKEAFIVEQRTHQRALESQKADLARAVDECEHDLRQARQELTARGSAPFRFGDFERTTPLSDSWGVDRGTPADRPFIEQFLARHRDDIRGRVLEVKDSAYTDRFGTDVMQTDVLDVDSSNPRATVIADLAAAGSIPDDTYDCFICTQTLGLIYDVTSALRHAERILKPGGVFLCTLPAAGRLSSEPPGIDGDYWRFTDASTRRLFAEGFPTTDLSVESFGNVLSGAGFLYGLAAHELPEEAFSVADPSFPIVYCVRAVKARSGRRAGHGRSRAPEAASRAILMYHRIGPAEPRHLTIPSKEFLEHLHLIRSLGYRVCDLAELALDEESAGRRVAITVDDGYEDALTVASPILEELGCPATFFVVAASVMDGGAFWWDIVDHTLLRADLPASIRVPFRDGPEDLPMESADNRLRARDRLFSALYLADLNERQAILDALVRLVAERRRLSSALLDRDQVVELARKPGMRIGSHTLNHLWLPTQTTGRCLQELTRSKSLLENLLGQPVRALSYPFGGTAAFLQPLAAHAGYDVAVTTESRRLQDGDERLLFPRIDAGALTANELLLAL